MLAVLWAIARNVEGGEASGMLAELMTPEAWVVLLPRDPVCVHVLEEIVPAEWLEKSANIGAVIGRYERSVGETIGGVWRWDWIILSSQIAVLRV